MINSLTPGMYVAAFDFHYPKVSKPALNALLQFMEANPIKGFIFGGDQHDNAEISHHNRRKIIYKETGSYEANTTGFDRDVLTPIEKRLTRGARKVWIDGNHEDWEKQLIEEQPQLKGTIERHKLLKLKERGWQIIPIGQMFQLGKLGIIHGESLKGTNHAKNAVETFAQSVAYGHYHTVQSYTKILPQSKSDKWIANGIGCMCDTNPDYLRSAPHAWLNGFAIIELDKLGHFNLHPIIITNGKFSFGGKTYGG